MKKISLLTNPTEVLIVCGQLHFSINENLNNNQTILYLDGLQNPGNMGTIIRTADWYGISQIICSFDSVDYYHPKVVQAAMGSHNRMHQFVSSLAEVKAISELNIIGTTLGGKPLNKAGDISSCIIVIGNEGKGIRPENVNLLDQQILIPGSSGKIAESLNAGIACAVVLDRLFGE